MRTVIQLSRTSEADRGPAGGKALLLAMMAGNDMHVYGARAVIRTTHRAAADGHRAVVFIQRDESGH